MKTITSTLRRLDMKLLAKNSLVIILILTALILVFHPYCGKTISKIISFRIHFIPFFLIVIAISIWKSKEIIHLVKENKITISQILLALIAAVLFVYLNLNIWPITIIEFIKFIVVFLIIEVTMILHECEIILNSAELESKQNGFDPIPDPSGDLLNRTQFCHNIFSMLKEQQDSNIRYALTGKWGSGKSTCLNFIAKFARDEGYPVVEFSSWQYQTKEEAWQGFISAIDRGIAEWKGITIGPFKPNKAFIKFINAIGVGIKKNSIGSLINELFLSKIRIDYYETKKQVAKILQRSLKGKKLFIFIDDFDRVPDEVLYQFLMTIRDVIDLPGCIFICAFDQEATYSILERRGIANKEDYLNKIFQETIEIPELVKWGSESIKHFYNPYSSVRPELIDSMVELLPSNPRQIRNYFSHLNNIHFLLERFGDDDLKWGVLYLIELGRIRFPEAMDIIVQDGRLFEVNAMGVLLDKDEYKKFVKKLDSIIVFTESNERNCFWSLIKKLISTAWGLGKEGLQSYFAILSYSHSEFLTWKEYMEWRSDNKLTLLKKLCNKDISIDSRREFLKMLLRERDIHLSMEADVFANEERTSLLERAILLTNEAMWFVCQDELHGPDHPIFGSSVAAEWLSKLGKWAHFNGSYYGEIRAREEDLVKTMARKTLHLAEELLKNLRSIHPISDSQKAFHPTIEYMKNMYENELARILLLDMRKPGRVLALWGKDDHWEIKDLFMRFNDTFYNKTNLEMLANLAAEAYHNYSIQENFFQMLRLILYYGVDNGDIDAQELLKHDNIREMFWNAVTCRPFQRRSMGSLLETRRKLGGEILQRIDIMPIPKWFQDTEIDMVRKNEIILS